MSLSPVNPCISRCGKRNAVASPRLKHILFFSKSTSIFVMLVFVSLNMFKVAFVIFVGIIYNILSHVVIVVLVRRRVICQRHFVSILIIP